MIDDLVAFPVETPGQHLLAKRHAHGVRDTLTQRSGGRFHAGRFAVFGMARGSAVQLTEVLQLIKGQFVAGKVQQRVEQHGTMPV